MMTERHETQLREAFRDFADVTTAFVRPPGAGVARERARVRVRNRRLAASVMAAAAVVLSVGTAAAIRWTAGDGSSPAVTTTATSPAPTVTTPAPVVVAHATDGPGDLADATIVLTWSNPHAAQVCSGAVTFTDGAHEAQPGAPRLQILRTMRLDVDRDGTEEVVAEIICQTGQVGPVELVAIRPGASPTTLGVVVESAAYDGNGRLDPVDGIGIVNVTGYVGLDDGMVRVDVADRFTCCGTPQDSRIDQQRVYGWNGSSFDQTGGPRTFLVGSAEHVSLAVPTLRLNAPVEGYRAGVLSVAVVNDAPATARDVSVFLSLPWGLEVEAAGDWTHCTVANGPLIDSTVCRLGDLVSGQRVALTLPVRRESTQENLEQPAVTTYLGSATARTTIGADTFAYADNITVGLTLE